MELGKEDSSSKITQDEKFHDAGIGHDWTPAEMETLLAAPLPDLVFRAHYAKATGVEKSERLSVEEVVAKAKFVGVAAIARFHMPKSRVRLSAGEGR